MGDMSLEDEDGTDILSVNSHSRTCILFSDKFTGSCSEDEDGRSMLQILSEDCGAERYPSVYWCRYPQSRFWASSYVHYGNQASLDYICVAAALVLKAWDPSDRYPNLAFRKNMMSCGHKDDSEPVVGTPLELGGFPCWVVRTEAHGTIVAAFVDAENFIVRKDLHHLAAAIATTNRNNHYSKGGGYLHFEQANPIYVFCGLKAEDAFLYDCHRLYDIQDRGWQKDKDLLLSRCIAFYELSLSFTEDQCWALVKKVVTEKSNVRERRLGW